MSGKEFEHYVNQGNSMATKGMLDEAVNADHLEEVSVSGLDMRREGVAISPVSLQP